LAAWPEALRSLADALHPGAEVEAVEPLAPDASGAGEKAEGYGRPLRVTVRTPEGERRRFVFRTLAPDEYGHDRRADRFDEALLAYDAFAEQPRHVRALDVGAVREDGALLSLRGVGEPWLATEWAEGTLYADDLRRVAREGVARPLDLARCDALADHLVALHAAKLDDRVAWRRTVRDLLGHGEGIFGVVDAFPDDVPAAPPRRLLAIEARCLAWRWRLRGRSARLARTHGDFHPFNLVFRPPGPGEDGTGFTALDASRGGKGDPADDCVALSVNYVFFALERRGSWARGLGPLWRRFWDRYLSRAGDPGLLEAAPPFLAWRALVLASPRFYPRLGAGARDAILSLAEASLDAGLVDLDAAEAIFAGAAP
jgi:aminoglycoside phosphotransferase (APT) family kinase protein